MRMSFWHISDRELLLDADGGLSPRRGRRVRAHLGRCAPCAARASTIERGTASALRSREIAAPGTLPSHAAARARLRARLAELSHEPVKRTAGAMHRWAAAFALLAVTAGLPWAMSDRSASLPALLVEGDGVFLLPRPELTPGATLQVTAAEVCADDRRLLPGEVDGGVQRTIFEQYGADFARAAEYELDHLITPELGGASDERNLWPQPFGGTVWNAYVKDELELHLHELVCEGAIDLATAQREISTDWIAAYKQRFNTDRPRRDYAAEPLTADDAEFLRAELAELGIEPPAGQSEGPALLALLQTARQNAWR